MLITKNCGYVFLIYFSTTIVIMYQEPIVLNFQAFYPTNKILLTFIKKKTNKIGN